ncbi:hypothetical protein NQ315_009728 [Exocentrus adspersus]|uniref:Glutamine amidotransferase type-2 domain-containing protein n=1 Tax=Exocentrus adspersus TaxID=1586481 RepID=A0AAV8WHF9_9CUCU|nr:hypothetical protein NQ315_009728 [Exocentrus adspersus]
MCGIICICSNTQKKSHLLDSFQCFKDTIKNRGPDSFDVKTYDTKTRSLLLSASVLWLQGRCMTKQPLETVKAVLVYNGDIFGGLPDELVAKEGDTKLIFDLLRSNNKPSSVLCQLQGPYAFIYFDGEQEKLYFGRDVYGRRSLLIGKSRNEVIVLTSVAKRSKEFEFIELPSIGTFSWDLKTDVFTVHPWQYYNPQFNTKLIQLKQFLNKEVAIEPNLENCKYFKFTEPSVKQLALFTDIKNAETKNIFQKLLNDTDWLKKVSTLKTLLENSVEKRIATQPKRCKDCIIDDNPCRHSLTGVLFSGGVDCAILALIADKFTDKDRPIDLINVAFDESNSYKTPDRVTGLQTLEELRTLRPERTWNFLEINVSRDELNEERSKRIADLIYPLQTVLDDSLGCALWFASRAQHGTVQSSCRVLLVGMGADELFGGYTRHRAALKRSSWSGLHDVLVEDWQNLAYRNLGRDDRVVSDHGRQLRTPYLDENVVKFVCSLNCWEKTYPSDEVPQGIGEKILLRSLAYHLGLKIASTFRKRALQFGSRIANKKENAHEVSERLCF